MPVNLQPIGVWDTRPHPYRHIGAAEVEDASLTPIPILVEAGFDYGELLTIPISVHHDASGVDVSVDHVGEFYQCQCCFHICIHFVFYLSCVFIPYEPLADLIQLTE
jgi:hypothetical protein